MLHKQPCLFVIGSPKAATTSICNYLDQHPDILMSQPKEPNYFNTDFSAEHRRFHDFETYRQTCFQSVTEVKYLGEGTVWYLYSSEAISKIIDTIENPRFVVMLRNPIDLAYSLHSTLLRSFQEDISDFKSAWQAIPHRKNNRAIPEHCRDKKLLYYDEIASQGALVKRLLSQVGRKQVFFITYDEISQKPHHTFTSLLNFLGLPEYKLASYDVKNPNRKVKNKTLARIAQGTVRVAWLYKLKLALGLKPGNSLIEKAMKLNNKIEKRASLDPAFRDELKLFFKSDLDILNSLIDPKRIEF